MRVSGGDAGGMSADMKRGEGELEEGGGGEKVEVRSWEQYTHLLK